MPARILFQPINTVGLGHVSRLTAIAAALREQAPSTEVLFAIDGHDHGISSDAGFATVSIPGPAALRDPSWKSWANNWPHQLARRMASTVLESLRPNAVVFDLIPNPAFLELVRAQSIPYFLCVRKHRGTAVFETFPDATRFIVPHAQGELEVPDELGPRCSFVGAIVRPVLGSTHHHSGPNIVITGGGGGFPKTVDFYNLVMAALEGMNPEKSVWLVTGPLFKDWEHLRVVPGIRVVPFVSELSRVFAKAELVVCQAGYNTVAEVARAGCRAVFVPAPRSLDDQGARAREQAQRSSGLRVFEGHSPEDLRKTIEEISRLPAPGKALAEPDGAEKAARLILDFVQEAANAVPPR